MCKGYYEICECEDCRAVADLYEELEWYEHQDREEFAYEIKELEDKIEGLGYCI